MFLIDTCTYKVTAYRIWGDKFRLSIIIMEMMQRKFVVAEILWKLVVTRPCELVKTLPCVVIPSENS